MFKTLVEAFKIKDLRKKIFLTLGLLLIYRIGCWIPCPGLNVSEFDTITSEGFMGLLSAVSGGALANGAILALGISPYISATIIVQLLTMAIPSWERLAREGGEEGRKRIGLYNRIAALILATVQAIAIVLSFNGIINAHMFGVTAPTWVIGMFVVIMLVAGSMFTYWIGEKITEIGVGQGVSLLIFVGILSTATNSILNSIINIFQGNLEDLWYLLVFLAVLVVVFAFIVWIDLAERKIPVQYAKQIKGRKMYGGQSTYIPVKINATGVMPIIFATTLLSFPQMIMSLVPAWRDAYLWYGTYMGAGSWPYLVVVALLILAFSYFWAQAQFDPERISKDIQRNGGFIPGLRAGKATSDYIRRIVNRMTLFGAIFLTIIFIVPSLLFKGFGADDTLINAFSTTGLLIVVSVAIEIDKSLQSQMLMRSHKGFLNK